MAFAPVFGRVFPATFDRHAAVAAAANWWEVAGKTCVAAYQAKGPASLAASYVNLANPGTYDAAPGTAPSWASGTGWTFNGSTQYLTTGVVPTFSAGQSPWTMLVRFSGASTDGGTLAGQFTAGARFDLAARQLFNDAQAYGNGDAISVAPRISSGVMAVAGNTAYLDGVETGAAISAGYATNTSDIWIANRNGATDYYAGDIQAVAIYSDTLTAGEIAILEAAMAAL